MTSRRSLRSVLSVVAVGATVFVAACGPSAATGLTATTGQTVETTAAPTPPAVPAVVSSAPTEAGNELLAQREADRLIADARVPAKAVRVSRAPHGLEGPLVEPAVSSRLVRSAFWTIRMPFTTAVASVGANPPAGPGRSSASSGSGPQVETAGFDHQLVTRPT